jgi:cell division protein FtsZ
MTFDPENSIPPGAKIKVIGVGGGGGNAVNTMIRSGLDGVDFITCNTDVQALRYSLAPHKLQIGRELTRGLGAGADPDIGRDAALEDKTEIQNVLRDADMVFITAGMGGGTGTGGAAVVAQLARELGALTVGVVTKPFIFEGKRRRKQAEAGIARLRESVDTLITIPNQRLLQVASPDLSMIDAFKMADEVLVNAVRGISDIINIHGVLNVDFADVKTVMSCMGQALMGIGSGRGEKRAVEAALMAISSPLLEEVDIEGATGILINITGGSGIKMHEINEACGVIQEAAHEDANIIFGAVIDEGLGDELRVTVIATGFPVEKAEGDSDPSRGKPFPSLVASRLATAAGLSEKSSAKIGRDVPKPQPPIAEAPLEIEELPQSPYDDLAFSNKENASSPIKAIEVVEVPPAQQAIHSTTAVIETEPQRETQVTSAVPQRPLTQAPEAPQVGRSSYSASNFAANSADEAHELARWTLDFSSSEGMNLTDDIPSLASPAFEPFIEEEKELQGIADDHTEKTLGSPENISQHRTEEKAVEREGMIYTSSSEVMEEVTLTPSTDQSWLHADPKEEFVTALNSTMGHPRLADTLFDESIAQDQSVGPILTSEESTESLAIDTAAAHTSLDLSFRQGATKEEAVQLPFLSEIDDMDLAEIDRQIDEALDLADRMRSHRQAKDSDDLDVPAFLRANMKDIALD